jgi:predicted DNA-binding transcriptional regulator AlpA
MTTLWTTADIARAFGVRQRTVTDKWTKRPDFPPPKQRISRKVVRWAADDVERWATGATR